jgi:hypothetical protein
MRELFVAMLLVVAGCSSKQPEPHPAAPAPAIDAAVPAPVESRPVLPVTGHLDDDEGVRHAPPASPNRNGKPIDVVLRSTPTGASAAVDGIVIGTTPAYWNGNADGREHEFTFVLPGHAIARYRFVPITSGTIHARLERVSDDVDAGVPPPEVVLPQLRPDAAPSVTPDAASPAPFGPLP